MIHLISLFSKARPGTRATCDVYRQDRHPWPAPPGVEVVDNSIDEALAGYRDHVWVTVNGDGSCTVVDNGRGIPVHDEKATVKAHLKLQLTVLHAGGKFDKETYQVSGGLHGVGVSVVNALSSALKATVYRDGNIYEMSFARGKPTGPIPTRARDTIPGIQSQVP